MANEYLKENRIPTEKKDCSVIALSYACDLDYMVAHEICEKLGRKNGKGFSLCHVFAYGPDKKFLKFNDFRKYTFDKKDFTVSHYDSPHMTIERFRKKNPSGVFILNTSKHTFCLKNGEILNQLNLNARIKSYYRIISYNPPIIPKI